MFIRNIKPKTIDCSLLNIHDIEEKLINKETLTLDEVYSLLGYICFQTRIAITNDLENETFEGKDFLASSIVYNYLKEINVQAFPRETSLSIGMGVKSNYFVIARIKTDLNGYVTTINYLIDPTFIQHMTREKCDFSNEKTKNGIIYQKPDVGYYIHPEDFEYIKEFIEYGYAFMNSSFLEIYGNAFLNTKVPTDNKALENKYGYKYKDLFLDADNAKIMSKEELDELGMSVKPTNNKIKRL